MMNSVPVPGNWSVPQQAKLMVLAIHQQLLNLAAGAGRYRLLYADTAHQTLSWLDEQPRQVAAHVAFVDDDARR